MTQKTWKTLQFSVFAAVLFSNIYYQWTPNEYVASIVALLAALFVTAIPIAIAEIVGHSRRPD
jgi:uncharacterized membrane protein